MTVKVQNGYLVPLTPKEIKELKPKLMKSLEAAALLEIEQRELNQLKLKQSELANRKMQLANERATEERKLSNIERKIEKGNAKIAKAEAEDRFLNVEIFCIALGIEPPRKNDIAKIDEITSSYFPKGEIGETADGKIALKSMKPFRKYLKDSERAEGIFKLNFTPIQVVEHPENLVDFLKKHPEIKAIGLDEEIKDTLDPILNQLCPLKERTFTVVYVPRNPQENAPNSTREATIQSQNEKKESREKQINVLREKLKNIYIKEKPAFEVLMTYLSENPGVTPKEGFIHILNLSKK